MVRLWSHHHRRCSVVAAYSSCVHHRYSQNDVTCDFHVQHALRVQVKCSPFSHSSFTQDDVSILYKTKLPFILVFNKTDVQQHGFAVEWMQDFEAFQAALASHGGTTDDAGEPTYMNSLMNSMSLVLDEFYKHLTVSPNVLSIVLMTNL